MIHTQGGHYLGWRPDKPDFRDHSFALRYFPLVGVDAKLPQSVDLRVGRPGMPGVYDQADTGSCTANSIAAAIEFAIRKTNQREYVPSRLFIYYNERYIEGDVGSDSGAELRDGIKAIRQWGVCPENPQPNPSIVWPFDPHNMFVRPTDACYTAAQKGIVRSYARVDQTTNGLRSCLAAGFPVLFGFTVYSSFDSKEVAASGICPMPTTADKVEGGHAVLIVGYDDATKYFMVRNSWGSHWGLHGYFKMPYDYVLNPDLATDFWQIDAVAQNQGALA